MTDDSLPLSGWVVLVARPEGRGEDLASRRTSLGAKVVLEPTIAFAPSPDPARVRDAITRIEGYDWLVFTSGTGARFFAEALRDAGRQATTVGARIAAVGDATARALRAVGLDPGVTARDSRAEGLAAALGDEMAPGRRVLWVRPEESREVLSATLREMGAVVDEVPFYRTVAAPGARRIAEDVARGAFTAVVFTSPSSFRFLVSAAGEKAEDVRSALGRVRRIAIGPVTGAELAAAGLPASAVAASPTEEGIAAAFLSLVRT